MRWRGALRALAILSTLAVPAAAQAPAPTRTAFDGKYVGTIAELGGGRAGNCGAIERASLGPLRTVGPTEIVWRAVRSVAGPGVCLDCD